MNPLISSSVLIIVLAFIGIGIIAMDMPIFEKEEENYYFDSSNPKYFNKKTKFLYEQIQAANFCKTSYDCVRTREYCPLGCDNYVNKSKAEDIKILMEKIESNTCMYDCSGSRYPLCKENKCVSNDFHYP